VGIAAVAFDYGNVISVPQDPLAMRRLAAIGGVTEEEARDIAFSGREDWDRGDLSGPDHYRRGFARIGRPSVDAGLLDEFMRADLASWAALNSESLRLMEDVRSSGTRTAILSNMPHEFIRLVRGSYPIVGMADVCVFSAERSVVKPDRTIYDILLRELGLAAGEVLFFDDMEPNVAAARELGMRAVLWRNPEDARNVLIEAGVLKR
jgi:putative hydrolase of the HAD superfamily